MRLRHFLGEFWSSEEISWRDHLVQAQQDVTGNVARRQERQTTDFACGVQFHHVLELGSDAMMGSDHMAVEVELVISVLEDLRNILVTGR